MLDVPGLQAPDDVLATHVFASHRSNAIESVWQAGQARVVAGRHALRERAGAGFLAARRQLLDQQP
ncbi:N-formimino-L-glutamate deiminase [compost metagenome]